VSQFAPNLPPSPREDAPTCGLLDALDAREAVAYYLHSRCLPLTVRALMTVTLELCRFRRLDILYLISRLGLYGHGRRGALSPRGSSLLT